MIDLAIPNQMYPDCNIITKFNIDTDHDYFLINELKFSLASINMTSASMEWKTFKSVNSKPLVANTLPELVRYNFQKDYLLINHPKYNPYVINNTNIKDFKSQLIINNETLIQQYGSRIVTCTLDSNILPFTDYDLEFIPQFVHFEYDDEYLYVYAINSQDSRFHLIVFSNYKNLRNSVVYTNNAKYFTQIIDYSKDDRIITGFTNTHFIKLKIESNKLTTIHEISINNNKNTYLPTNAIKPKTMYNLGLYALADDGTLQFINDSEYDNSAKSYNVLINYNNFPEIITSNIISSNCTFIDNEQFDLYLCDANSTYIYRIQLDPTSDLKCTIIGHTVLTASFNNFTRVSSSHPEIMAGMSDSYRFVLMKYIHDLNIYEVIEDFTTTSLAFFTLNNSYTYYTSHDVYGVDNIESTEIHKRKIKPCINLYIDVPELIEQNVKSHFSTAVYDILNNNFIKNMPIEFNIKNGHFLNNTNTLWFYSQQTVSLIDFFSESGNDSIKITYNFKGSQNESSNLDN